jgi:rhamnosyl/mannosyltransferase
MEGISFKDGGSLPGRRVAIDLNISSMSSAAAFDPKVARRRSVLHVGKFYAPHVGGIETHLETLCRGLSESMDVRVLVANDLGGDEETVADGVNVSRHAIRFSLAGAPVCPSMVRKIRQANADIVHVHVPNPAGILAVMASGYRGRLVTSWHSDTIRQRRLAKIFAPIQRRYLSNCDAIIAASPNYVESSLDLANFKDRCRVIPYGIEVEEIRRPDMAAVKQIRERYPGPLLLTVGRLVYYKGFEYVVRAMKRIAATLLIVGDGPLRASLERLAAAEGVANRVVFVGQAGDVTPYYHACDVFVLASIARSEAFGIVQLEAMACGKPVVNTRLKSGVPFASLDEVTGLTVDPGNVEALEIAVNRLLADSELRARFGEAAKKRVDVEFSSSSMLSRTRELYEELLAAEPRRMRAISHS